MKKSTYLLLTAALVFAVAVGTGCQKKAPKDAKELAERTTSRVPSAEASDVLTINPDGTMKIGPLMSVLPDGWKSVQPASSMRRAQFEIPAAEGDAEPGVLAVFYFGPQAGGVEANITRWINQFQQPNGEPLQDDQVIRTDFTVNGMPVTMVRFHGTQKPSSMPGMAATPAMENWMNISGIVMTPDGPWFFKGTGPQKTMEAQVQNFETFFQKMRYAGEPQPGENPHAAH